MPEDLLSAREVKDKYGIDRNKLISWEEMGVLPKDAIVRTQGGQRRYRSSQIEDLNNQPNRNIANPETPVPVMAEFGATGLKVSAGQIYEEEFRELQGLSGRKLLREMRLNDPVIAATFSAIENMLRKVKWRSVPASESQEDKDAASFLEQCLDDMSFTFSDTIQFALQMLEQGFSLLEIVYKKRLGDTPGFDRDGKALPDSKYNDGKIGWRKWAPRPAITIDDWIMDDTGGINGAIQRIDGSEPKRLPIEKCLLFRTTVGANNSPEGQALALDTKVPTPYGFREINELEVGDKVFGSDGKIRYVTWKSPVWENRPAYEIKFRNGEVVIADENHIWTISTAFDRRKGRQPRVLTTKEIFDFAQKGIKGNGISFGTTPVLDTVSDDYLPIDPYILGYWLGDGSAHNGSIGIFPPDDEPFLEYVRTTKHTVTHRKDLNSSYVADLKPLLRNLGVLENKRIPRIYLNAPYHHRLALLQGLMDSDGCVGDSAHAPSFYNANLELIQDVQWLISSLGGRKIVRELGDIGKENKMRNGRIIIQRRKSYGISFFIKGDTFKLKRKQDRVGPGTYKAYAHFLKDIKQLPTPIQTVCIEVDAPDHQFLVSPSFIPTHNSIHRSMYLPWRMTVNLMEIEGIGIERDLAGIPTVYLGDGCTLGDGPNTDFSIAKELVVNLRNDDQTGIVIPKPKMTAEGRGMLVELLASGGKRSHNVGAVIERYDKQKALSVLAQFIMLGMGSVGSFALSSHQGDLFTMAITAWLQSIADTINRYAIKRLFKYNSFPGITGLPKLEASPVGLPDLFQLANYVNLLRGAELLHPDAELENHLRHVAGLPSRPETEDKNPQDEQVVNKELVQQGIHLRRMVLTAKMLRDLNAISPQEADMMVEKPLVRFRELSGIPQPSAEDQQTRGNIDFTKPLTQHPQGTKAPGVDEEQPNPDEVQKDDWAEDDDDN